MSDGAVGLPKRLVTAGRVRSPRKPAQDDPRAHSPEHLLKRLRQGDHDALSLLFDHFHRMVLKVCLKILRDPGEAEDVMQEVFFEIYRVAEKFDPARGSAKAWILQYAYHRSINRRRYLELRKMYASEQIARLDVLETYYSPNGNSLTAQEVSCLFQQGLESLSGEQRHILEQVCLGGIPLAEVARRMGKTLTSVQHHYYRGLRRLWEFLRDEEPPWQRLAP